MAFLSWLGSDVSAADYGAAPSAQPNIVVAPGGLRWRNATNAAPQAAPSHSVQAIGNSAPIDEFAQPIATVQPAGWVQRTAGEQPADARPAANLRPIQPIHDPYGERTAQAPAPLRPLRPAPAAPPPSEEVPLVTPKEVDPGLPAPAAQPIRPIQPTPRPMNLQPIDDPAPPPMPMPMRAGPLVPSRPEDIPLADPMPRRPAPPFEAPLVRRGADCDKIYNGRNFCEEDGECRAAIRSLARKPLSAISLDITPSYDPTAADQAAADARMQERLASMESFVWKNRRGETVATGKLIDFDKGDAIILGDNGQTTRIVARTLNDDSHAYLNAWWGLPHDCRLSDTQYKEIELADFRYWEHPLTMAWKPSALCHKPLYFEETCLERYGHTTGPWTQPFVSAAHFFGSVAFLPYKLGMDPYNECQYALGYYRPGSCAPWYIPAVPISPRGAAAQVGFYWGAAYIIP